MRTIEIGAQAMQADLQRLTHISQNLANSQTAGYKRAVSVQRPFSSQLDALAASEPLETSLDTNAGSLRATGNPMDVAIDGDGYFVLDTAQGPALTRQLALRIDAKGMLVNAAGLPVRGGRGTLQVGMKATEVTVDARGDVMADGRSLGRLEVVRVSAGDSLRSIGGGMYRTSEKTLVETVDAPKVMPGYQEASNVNSSSEMVRLMETSRHFEAVTRVVQGYDEAIEKAIRKLGDL